MVDTFRDPFIPEAEKSLYAVSIGDDPTRSEFSSVITAEGDRYRSILDGAMPGEFRITVEQTFDRTAGMLAAQTYSSKSWHGDQLVSSEEGNFVDTAHLQFGGKVQPFPSRMTPLLGGMIVFRGLDFAKGVKTNVDLWLGFSVHWPIEIKVEKRTRIEVPAGKFDAWQVKVRPSFTHINGLLDKVIGGILPPFTLHFDAEGSHRMLRFHFPTGPMPWNPKGLVELTRAE
ncbi:hypothetical protein [Nocardia sp. NPDC052566]|uniref:hypothetical protein n=1 Tax=Nocardia sp. NPDC052566 TaxID=3364330 RepID=UPI0037CB022A